MTSEDEKFSDEISKPIDLGEGVVADDAEANNAVAVDKSDPAEDIPWKTRMWEVFTTFWPLGFVAFGGPQAHIAILRDHLVVQRDWMDEDAFTGE